MNIDSFLSNIQLLIFVFSIIALCLFFKEVYESEEIQSKKVSGSQEIQENGCFSQEN